MANSNVAPTKVVPVESKVYPFYDDFDESKNFHRILFRPGYAVQARELTQMQTILQNQIERFGNHIFAEGSIVKGGQCTVERADVITVSSQYDGVDIDVNQFIGNTVTCVAGSIVSTSSKPVSNQVVRAKIFAADVSSPTAPAFAINYMNSGATLGVGATIQIRGSTTNASVTAANTQIRGSVARVEEGIFFISGYFVKVPKQFLILSKNNSKPSYRVGLELQDEIVTEDTDISLLDPAQESYNYQAPGGARYRVNLQLVKKELDDEFDTSKFIELMTIENGVIKRVNKYPIYSDIGDTMARRTFEESGDYTVDPFMLELKANASNDLTVIASLDPGRAYVKGYRFETTSSTPLDIDKARTTRNIQNYSLNMPQGNYINVTRVRGNTFFDTSVITTIDMHSVPASLVQTANSFVYNSTKIGRATIRNMVYSSSSDPSVSDTFKFQAYVTDTNFTTLTSDSAGANANTTASFALINKQSTGAAIREYGLGIPAGASGELKILFNTYAAWNNVIVRSNSTSAILLRNDTDPLQPKLPTEVEIQEHVSLGGSRFIGSNGVGPSPGEADQSRFGIIRLNVTGGEGFTVNVGGTTPFEYSAIVMPALSQNKIRLATGPNLHKVSSIDGAYTGATIAIYAGRAAGYKGFITAYDGETRIATVSPAFTTVLPNATSKYSITFDEGDIRSFVSLTGTTKVSVADVDISSIYKGASYFSDKAYDSLVYALPDSPIAAGSIADQRYAYKHLFKDRVFDSLGDHELTITTEQGLATGAVLQGSGVLTSGQILSNYLVVVRDNNGSANIANGQVISYTRPGASVNVTGTGTVAKFTGGFDADVLDFNGFKADILATVNINNGTLRDPRSKTLVSGNNYAAVINSPSFGPYGASITRGYYTAGQVYIQNPNRIAGQADNLYMSDVLRIRGIYASTTSTIAAGTQLSGGGLTDVTKNYTFDNGQTGTLYDHAKIILKPGYSAPKGALLVVFDYFDHGATGGYFSVDSYTNVDYEDIPSFYNRKRNITYKLRDCIDFRAVRTNGSNTASTYSISNGRIPVVDSNFQLDYNYYLGRIDKIVLKSSLEFDVIKGRPSDRPQEPKLTDSDMLLYTLKVPAYTFNAKDIDVEMKENKRYTMRDIGALETRIENLEYYSTLSLLEKSAMEKTVLDNNGLDRTKYGIIVDSFTSFAVGQEDDADFKAAINRTEGSLLAETEISNLGFDVYSRSGVVVNNDIAILNYSRVPAITQPYASKPVSIQDFLIPRIDGDVRLVPETDIWYSTEILPDTVIPIDGGTSNHPGTTYEDLGDRVTDVSIIPYMRARPIKFLGQGLRRDRVYYPFFDGVSVRNYIARANELTVRYTGGSTAADFRDLRKGAGESLVAKGNSVPLLLVKANTMYVGPEIADEFDKFVDDPSDPDMTKFISQRKTDGLAARTHNFTYKTEATMHVLHNVYKAFNSVEIFISDGQGVYNVDGTLNTSSPKVTKIFSADGYTTQGRTPNDKEIKEYLSIPYTGANIAPSKYIGALGAAPELGTSDRMRFAIFEYHHEPDKANTVHVVVGRLSPASLAAASKHSPYQFAISFVGKNRQLATEGSILNGQYITGSRSNATAQILAMEHYSGAARPIATTSSAYDAGIKLSASASSMTNFYTGNTIYIVDGSGEGQSRTITSYNGISKLAMTNADWTVKPTSNTIYSIGPLETNEYGDLPGVYFLPSNSKIKFRTGERPFKLTESPANDDEDSICEAEHTYKAEGLNITKQGDTLAITTRPPPPPPPIPPFPFFFFNRQRDPIAQSFFVDPAVYPRGMFIESIDVFFARKDATAPVTLKIRYMDNGYPAPKQVPGAKAVVQADDVNISTTPRVGTAATATKFKFPNPVMLPPGEYCFVLYCPSQETEVWVAELGATWVGSTSLISKAPYLGSMFKSQNDTTWTAFQFEDIMFNINRCFFSTGIDGIINLWSEKQREASYFDRYLFNASDIVPKTTKISYEMKTSADLDYVDITPKKLVTFPTIDGSYTRRRFERANGSIKIRATMSTDDNAISPILDVQRLALRTYDMKINQGGIYDRNVKIKNSGSGYTSDPVVTVSAPGGSGTTAIIKAYADDDGEINDYEVINPGSGYFTTPTITVTGGGGTGAELEITTEESPSGGNMDVRYFTKQVTLAEGFDAGDLRVYLDAYRPAGTDVAVYYKVLNNNDSTPFDNRPWIKMRQEGRTVVSRTDSNFIEYEFSADDGDGRMRYNKNDDESQFRTFRYFAIKIVMTSDKNNTIPRVRNFRAMAFPGNDT